MMRGRAALCAAALLMLAGARAMTPWPLAAHAVETVKAAAGNGQDPLAGRFGGPFSLIDADGHTVSDQDFRDRFMLVYFGYTHCPDVCPLDLAVMTEALDLIGPLAAEVRPIFITVDPARDTAQLMAEYAKSFSPHISALSGSEAQIAAVARAYKVHRRKIPTPGADQPADYVVDHGSLTYLMGPDGTFRTLIAHNTPAERMAAVIGDYVRREARTR